MSKDWKDSDLKPIGLVLRYCTKSDIELIKEGLDSNKDINQQFLDNYDRYLCPNNPESIEFSFSSLGNSKALLIDIIECPKAAFVGTKECIAS